MVLLCLVLAIGGQGSSPWSGQATAELLRLTHDGPVGQPQRAAADHGFFDALVQPAPIAERRIVKPKKDGLAFGEADEGHAPAAPLSAPLGARAPPLSGAAAPNRPAGNAHRCRAPPVPSLLA
jgi:hypothetical protein